MTFDGFPEAALDFYDDLDTVKTAPRGYSAANPRIELLRHKTMSLSKQYGFEPFVHTSALLERVVSDWRDGRSLVEWLAVHLA